jgi:hypothetical protein
VRRLRSSFAIALGVRWVRVDLGIVVVVERVVVGDTTSQPVVLFSLVGLGLERVGVGIGVAGGGEMEGDLLLATFVGGGEVGESV